MKRKSSAVWEHFTEDEEDKRHAICKHCLVKVSRGSEEPSKQTTGGMWKHIQKHPAVFAEMQASGVTYQGGGSIEESYGNMFEKGMKELESFENKEDWNYEMLDEPIVTDKRENSMLENNGDLNFPKIVTTRKKRSSVWNHYDYDEHDQKYVICKHCSMKISQGSYDPKNKSTAPLKRHLKKHKIKFNKEFCFSKKEKKISVKAQVKTNIQEIVMNAKIELSMAIEELSVIAEKSLKNIHVMIGDDAESKVDELDSAVKTAKILVESLRDIFGEPIIMDTDVKVELGAVTDLVERDDHSDSYWDHPENGGLSDDDNKEDLKDDYTNEDLKDDYNNEDLKDSLRTDWKSSKDEIDENNDVIDDKEKIKRQSTFICDQCSMTFEKLREFKNHKKSHTENQQYSCDECNKVFLSKSILRQHHLIHTRDRVFYCDQCPKFYNRAGDLKIHQRLHSGDKPYICDQCSKAFAQSQHLKTHKSIHTGDRPFICDKCSKAFAQSSALVRHKRIHNNDKPFLCDQCDKAFVTSGHLKTHKRIHTGEKPLQCDKCPMTFSHYSSRNKHRQTHDTV